MYENLHRELKIFSVIGAILLIGAAVYVIRVLVPTPSPRISLLHQPLLEFPAVQGIQSESLLSGGCATGVYSPKNPPKIAEQTWAWLKDAQPLSVKISKPHDTFSSGCGLLYSSLELQTKNGDRYDLSPANYIWEKGSLFGSPKFETRYIENVIEVTVHDRSYFFKSKSLYDWLEYNGWKKDFNIPSY
ncbi:hypothetical protein [Paenibacillus humicola]|uniref:hypothetical protein n=1 Tax=Paenibacillus humicola TaxID=3110540 RepID=UPI00237AFEAA|nr:hypothetical protein [Paenibacillus humicola]